MLRTVLGAGQSSSGENNSKLLELADRDGDTPHAHTNGGAQPAVGEDEDEAPPGISSVITQVTVRQEHGLGQGAPQARVPGVDDQEVRNTWKNKLRSEGL
jgi:hypothetical protein